MLKKKKRQIEVLFLTHKGVYAYEQISSKPLTPTEKLLVSMMFSETKEDDKVTITEKAKGAFDTADVINNTKRAMAEYRAQEGIDYEIRKLY